MLSPFKRVAVGSFAVLGAFWLPSAFAAGTAANTAIVNTATATFTDSNTGTPGTATSNTTTLRVDEILGVTVVSNNPGPVSVSTPGTQVPLSFTITNPGNGSEPYRLTTNTAVPGDQYDPTNANIFLDSNGNGVYDPGVDQPYVSGSNDPVLNPDQSIVVFVLADTPAGRANGDTARLTLTATAVTGSGPAGTTFTNAGTGGVDAVVGVTTATAPATGTYVVAQVTSALNKTQAVSDPFGGNNPVPGATITYTLTLTVSGTGALNTAAITDVIPANTTYVPASITLNGAAITDASDADAGNFTGSSVVVNLGNLTAPATQTVSFQTRIN